ncbi:multi-sensor hybrid histidine kinase [Melioribacter roseus P3M-2]|uniref:histidine kinase n=1 Tax=Melioribacter roseus (strain DSM 23840 / JCM 17771 / VKM B-2668 / P3M-2) TaxID=1191523 RepID=I6Z6X8_MELRP|nr:ATP-binding protein [Melioribacter roseus]AFN74895.1 multi-sensor hybrid histidine kinase [Melioribacter roseus P3M-2]
MGLAVNTAKKFSRTLEHKVNEYIKQETQKELLSPFRSLAIFSAASGGIALIFEVLYFSEHSVELYVSRLFSVLVAFVLLVISNSRYGKERPVLLVHILLMSIVASFGVMIYLEPQTLVFNSHIISLIIFTAALFLSWEVRHQVLVAVYYNLVFVASAIANSSQTQNIPHLLESIVLVMIISVMAVVASYINYRLRREALLKSYEVALSEKKFRNIFENSVEGVFQITPAGKFTAVNPAFIRMLGYSTEEEINRLNFFNDLFKRKSDADLLNKLLEKQGKVKNYRVQFLKKDGSEIAVKMNVRLSYDEEEDATFFDGSLQDITQQVLAEHERQKALEALRQEKIKSDVAAQKARQESSYKTKFLANMSHEVRTPMNSVMGFLTLIENDLFESEEELKKFARDARLAAESLLDIINNILDISKIEAGKMELEENEFDLSDEIHKVSSIIGQTARQKGIDIKEQIDPDLPDKIYGDATRYRQVVLNLVSNAVKYTDEGSVTISVEIKNRTTSSIEILTSVEDTGSGIPNDKIPLLFEPYVQVKDKKSQKEGTGLGLVIAKEFVKLMGGDISVESKPGAGSKFYFTVKFKLTPSESDEAVTGAATLYKQTEAEVQEEEEKTVVEEQKSAKRLLLVEDNPISQDLELKILREVGYLVDAVSSGSDAIDAVKTGRYSLILMDIEMSDMDGIAATKQIRNIPGDMGKIPIIAVTAHSSMKDREKCLAAGMNDYIAKPINIQFLKLTIDQWLNRPLD